MPSAASTSAPPSPSPSACAISSQRLNEHGYVIDTLHVTGGHTRNPLLMELYADATRCRTVEPAAPDAVLLGTAMVAAAGAGLHPSLAAAGAAMHQGGVVREPAPANAARYERDWQVFLTMQRHRREVEMLHSE